MALYERKPTRTEPIRALAVIEENGLAGIITIHGLSWDHQISTKQKTCVCTHRKEGFMAGENIVEVPLEGQDNNP